MVVKLLRYSCKESYLRSKDNPLIAQSNPTLCEVQARVDINTWIALRLVYFAFSTCDCNFFDLILTPFSAIWLSNVNFLIVKNNLIVVISQGGAKLIDHFEGTCMFVIHLLFSELVVFFVSLLD